MGNLESVTAEAVTPEATEPTLESLRALLAVLREAGVCFARFHKNGRLAEVTLEGRAPGPAPMPETPRRTPPPPTWAEQGEGDDEEVLAFASSPGRLVPRAQHAESPMPKGRDE